MQSRLSEQAERALQERINKMTAEQRLDAFLEHCQLMAALFEAGKVFRERQSHPRAQ